MFVLIHSVYNMKLRNVFLKAYGILDFHLSVLRARPRRFDLDFPILSEEDKKLILSQNNNNTDISVKVEAGTQYLLGSRSDIVSAKLWYSCGDDNIVPIELRGGSEYLITFLYLKTSAGLEECAYLTYNTLQKEVNYVLINTDIKKTIRVAIGALTDTKDYGDGMQNEKVLWNYDNFVNKSCRFKVLGVPRVSKSIHSRIWFTVPE
jgi:hypothetical protein